MLNKVSRPSKVITTPRISSFWSIDRPVRMEGAAGLFFVEAAVFWLGLPCGWRELRLCEELAGLCALGLPVLEAVFACAGAVLEAGLFFV